MKGYYKMKYILNTNTGTLHIEGLCYHSRCGSKRFNSEDEARAYGRLSIKNCKDCFKKRDQILSPKSQ